MDDLLVLAFCPVIEIVELVLYNTRIQEVLHNEQT